MFPVPFILGGGIAESNGALSPGLPPPVADEFVGRFVFVTGGELAVRIGIRCR